MQDVSNESLGNSNREMMFFANDSQKLKHKFQSATQNHKFLHHGTLSV
jgi:hypothetical protein